MGGRKAITLFVNDRWLNDSLASSVELMSAIHTYSMITTCPRVPAKALLMS